MKQLFQSDVRQQACYPDEKGNKQVSSGGALLTMAQRKETQGSMAISVR